MDKGINCFWPPAALEDISVFEVHAAEPGQLLYSAQLTCPTVHNISQIFFSDFVQCKLNFFVILIQFI